MKGAMNTTSKLEPVVCPRPGCGRPMHPKINGGVLYLQCTAEPPKCGLIMPAESVAAWHIEKRGEERSGPALVPGVAGRAHEAQAEYKPIQ